jgi:exopolysaccharide production protein ExoQ
LRTKNRVLFRASTPENHRDKTTGQQLLLTVLVLTVIATSGAFQAFAGGGLGAWIVYGPIIVSFALLSIHFVSGHESMETRPKYKWLIMLTCAPLVLSTLWSTDANSTFRATILLLVITTSAVYCGKRIETTTVVRTIVITLAILGALSALIALLLPSVGIDFDARGAAWKGVFNHKNSLGRAMGILGCLSFFLLLKAKRTEKIFWTCITIFAIVVALKSNSGTAAGALAGGIVICLLSRRQISKSRIPTISASIVLIYVFLSISIPKFGPLIAEVFSRDPSLTGRTALWEISEYFAAQKPIFGWGYGSVWNTPAGVGQWIGAELTFVPSSAHNGLMDMRLQIGLVGTSLVMLGLVLLIRKVLRCGPGAAFLPVLGSVLIMDVTESALLFGFTWYTLWTIATSKDDSINAIQNKL